MCLAGPRDVHRLLSRKSVSAGSLGGQDRKVERVGAWPTCLHSSALLCACVSVCLSVSLCLFHQPPTPPDFTKLASIPNLISNHLVNVT